MRCPTCVFSPSSPSHPFPTPFLAPGWCGRVLTGLQTLVDRKFEALVRKLMVRYLGELEDDDLVMFVLEHIKDHKSPRALVEGLEPVRRRFYSFPFFYICVLRSFIMLPLPARCFSTPAAPVPRSPVLRSALLPPPPIHSML